jgi:hypothetical protein
MSSEEFANIAQLVEEELRKHFRDCEGTENVEVVAAANENYAPLARDERGNLSFSRALDKDDVEYLRKLLEQGYTQHPDFSAARAQRTPPGLAEALVVLFGPKRRVDAILGDLTERFNEELAQKGLKRARLLFWARVLRSIGPLLWAKIRKFGVFVTIYEIGRRFIGS